MTQDSTQQRANRSEGIARNWDLVSVGSFVSACLVGLVKTANDIRHQFFQSHIKGYDNKPTFFTDILDASATEFDAAKTDFLAEKLSAKAYNAAMHEIGNRRHTSIKERLHTKYNMATDTVLKDWTIGTWQRSTFLGRTDRVNAAMGFTGTALIALGAIAVLKHSSRVLDAINHKISLQNESEKGR